ncbi:MAG: triose-phosphate isomerase [Candidatus Cloacimonetes bacterium]|nr:triose-phosphate isomerase [Candidatus Cloacimonadota bacterium]
MRKIVVAGNWKMYKTYQEVDEFMGQLSGYLKDIELDKTDVIICPSSLFLKLSNDYATKSKFFIGAQNILDEDFGAFTGEISAPMLKSLKLNFCIVGHSERRKYYNEKDADVNRKIKKLLEYGLKPIVCVGESLEQRESGITEKVVLSQLEGAFEGIEFSEEIMIAYEPIWAIGTGKTASPEQAQEIHKLIRNWLTERYSVENSEKTKILYGGSVNPGNAQNLFSQVDIDGGLIGGASLKIDSFTKIIEISQML